MANPHNNTVVVALSGGVDSSVCVHLLTRQGFSVVGAVLDLSPEHAGTVEAAREAADALGIELVVLRDHERFARDVIDPFCRAYDEGRTPNPCVVCNPLVKFAMIDELREQRGYTFLATGHYAWVVDRGGVYHIARGNADRDQSYMLYRLPQAMLARLLLPLGGYTKAQVRDIALSLGLRCHDAPDSQENCFIPDDDYVGFIERRFGAGVPGELIAPDGSVAARHSGIRHFTIGQRKGFGVSFGEPAYVRRIEPDANRVILGTKGSEYFSSLTLAGCVWAAPLDGPQRCDVKVRSRAKPSSAIVTPLDGGRAAVVFDRPERAPSPGQSCVCYDGDVVLGGGFIETQE